MIIFNEMFNNNELDLVNDLRRKKNEEYQINQENLRILFEALNNEDLQEVERLIRRTPVIKNLADEHGMTALMICVLKKNEVLFEHLCGLGSLIEYKNQHGEDVLYYAQIHDHEDFFFKILEKQKRNIDLCPYHKKTRLMIAVEKSSLEQVKQLLEKNANVQARDDKGNTPLHYNFAKTPYTEDDKQIAALLLNKGCDPKATNNDDIPAYGLLENLNDVKDLLDVEKLPKVKSYVQKRITNLKNKDKKPVSNQDKDYLPSKIRRPSITSKTPSKKFK